MRLLEDPKQHTRSDLGALFCAKGDDATSGLIKGDDVVVDAVDMLLRDNLSLSLSLSRLTTTMSVGTSCPIN